MADIKALEARLDAAFARIDAALDGRRSAAGLAALQAAHAEQAETLARTTAELRQMEAERRRDADDVTAILADLRPLLEG